MDAWEKCYSSNKLNMLPNLTIISKKLLTILHLWIISSLALSALWTKYRFWSLEIQVAQNPYVLKCFAPTLGVKIQSMTFLRNILQSTWYTSRVLSRAHLKELNKSSKKLKGSSKIIKKLDGWWILAFYSTK